MIGALSCRGLAACLACVTCLACAGDERDRPNAGSTESSASGATGGAGGTGGSGATGGSGGEGGAGSPAHCFSGPLDVEAIAGGHSAITAHYHLSAEGSQVNAEEMARLLEASYGAYAEYFGAEPSLAATERLDVRFFADYDAWAAALVADGIGVPVDAGGYYDTASRVAYLYTQPTRYFTHELLLHEAAHQYHHLASGGLIGQLGWYVEGLAEHLQRHDWDGACARLGIIPLLTQEDSPASALQDIQNDGIDLTGIVDGSLEASRPILWSLVHYLENGDGGRWREAFHAFRDAVDGGETDELGAFTTTIAPPATLEQPLEAWLAGAQEPMSIVFLEWTHVGPAAVIGDSTAFSAAAKKDPTSHFQARFQAPATEPWAAGVLLDFDGPADFTGLVVTSLGTISTFEMVGGSATWFDKGGAPPPSGGGYELAVDYPSAGSVDVTINGQKATYPIANSARSGLVVNDSRVSFDGIAWRP